MDAKQLGSMPYSPVADFYGPGEPLPGITLRQHYAGLAMAAMCANPAMCDERKGMPAQLAEWAVLHADALLAELAKEPQP